MKITPTFAVAALFLGLSAVQSNAAVEESAPGNDGFIRTWLLLAPIQLKSDADGAQEIDRSQISDESQLKPKVGDKVTLGGKELTWRKIKTSDYYLDLNAILNEQTEKTVAYAVCYVRAEAERTNLMLKMGSNDQGKVFLNGKIIVKSSEPRSLDQDSDVVRNVTLNKGINVVVFKIFNEGGSDWQGCLRFAESNGKPVTNISIRLDPERH